MPERRSTKDKELRAAGTATLTGPDQDSSPHPITPDGRYMVVRGRLWRRTSPDLAKGIREALVADLMAARRAVWDAMRARDSKAEAVARGAVDRAKTALGERGPVWWSDAAPDLNRHMARTTPYAEWYCALAGTDR